MRSCNAHKARNVALSPRIIAVSRRLSCRAQVVVHSLSIEFDFENHERQRTVRGLPFRTFAQLLRVGAETDADIAIGIDPFFFSQRASRSLRGLCR